MRKRFVVMILALAAMVVALGCQGSPQAPPREFTNSVGMKFVLIAPGMFQMGSDARDSDEKPVHEVTLTKGFYLQATEVTQAQWQAVMGTNPSYLKGPERPVERVSWDDVQEFVRKLNAKEKDTRYRLPTEAEWEYACRAGGKEPDVAPNLDEVAWRWRKSGDETHPVGQKKPNALGLHDMRGNVWEWVQDWYGPYSTEPQVDPQARQSWMARVSRGGSWSIGLWPSQGFRCACRRDVPPAIRDSIIGFRCARTF
jgi:formylglycine-generating enzyme required for sulfatase activity